MILISKLNFVQGENRQNLANSRLGTETCYSATLKKPALINNYLNDLVSSEISGRWFILFWHSRVRVIYQRLLLVTYGPFPFGSHTILRGLGRIRQTCKLMDPGCIHLRRLVHQWLRPHPAVRSHPVCGLKIRLRQHRVRCGSTPQWIIGR